MENPYVESDNPPHAAEYAPNDNPSVTPEEPTPEPEPEPEEE